MRGVHSGEGGVFGEWRAGSAKALKVGSTVVTVSHRRPQGAALGRSDGK